MSVDMYDFYDSAENVLNCPEIENELYRNSLINEDCKKNTVKDYKKAIRSAEILIIMINNRILRGNDIECYWDEENFFNEYQTVETKKLEEEMLYKIKRSIEEDFVKNRPTDFEKQYSSLKKYLRVVDILKDDEECILANSEFKSTVTKLKEEFYYFYKLAYDIYNGSGEIHEWESIEIEEYLANMNSYL